jgi:hypothetical protein
MEVHHHTHHPKKWKEYFWEFFMLFLAVFCGFLAEYQLEHQIERDREKQFIKSYIDDLILDTLAINSNVQFRENKEAQLDSLVYFFREGKIRGYENDLYYLGRRLPRTLYVQFSDKTYSQLKYSGSFRLIRKQAVVDSILNYQKLVDLVLHQQEDEQTERRSLSPHLAKIFNPYIFTQMLNERNGIDRPVNNPPLRSYDTSLQQDLAFYINQIQGSTISLKLRLNLLKEKAKQNIVFLRKEYRLE